MPLELIPLPCLSDNYAYLLHNAAEGRTALVDAPEPGPIEAALAARGWQIDEILLTHHHYDHIDGLAPLRGTARVIGAAADAHRLPALDHEVADGDTITFCGRPAQVMDVSGHTMGHIALYLPEDTMVFTADSLMACGCGRLFEGTPATMWASLQRLRALPGDTILCSGHEYTQTNCAFALSVEPSNAALRARAAAVEEARAKGQPTVPGTLAEECATNPFLRADLPQMAQALDMADAAPEQVFAQLRQMRDRW